MADSPDELPDTDPDPDAVGDGTVGQNATAAAGDATATGATDPVALTPADTDGQAADDAGAPPGPRRRRRCWLVAGATVLAVIVFLGVTGFTGLPAPGALERYRYADLRSLANAVNDDAGDLRTPDDCWRKLEGNDGPLRSIAAVDYVRSRVVVRAYAWQSGVIAADTFNTIVDRIDRIITADPAYSWGMVSIEGSPDGWSPLLSCPRVLRGY